jgi:hypothetical protein
LNNLRRSGIYLSKAELDCEMHHALSPTSSCEWVPAAFQRDGMRLVYGGVALQPQFRNEVINPPPTSAYRLSGQTLAAQRQLGAPYSDTARIDNMNNANKKFFANQAAANNAAAAAAAAQKTHGSNFRREKAIFIARLMNDPKVASHIRGHYQNELRRLGTLAGARNPKGYDIDHTRDSADYMRLQYSRDNRHRGAMSRLGGKWEGYEKIRTRSQPGTNNNNNN